MINNLRTDQEELERLDGLFVGSLGEDEMELFNRAVKLGCARRCYEGAAGFIWLAKVALVRVPKEMP